MQGTTTIATIVNYRIALEFDSFSHCFFIRFRAPENCNNHVVTTTTTTTTKQQQQPKKHRIDCVQQVLVKYIYFFFCVGLICAKRKNISKKQQEEEPQQLQLLLQLQQRAFKYVKEAHLTKVRERDSNRIYHKARQSLWSCESWRESERKSERARECVRGKSVRVSQSIDPAFYDCFVLLPFPTSPIPSPYIPYTVYHYNICVIFFLCLFFVVCALRVASFVAFMTRSVSILYVCFFFQCLTDFFSKCVKLIKNVYVIYYYDI